MWVKICGREAEGEGTLELVRLGNRLDQVAHKAATEAVEAVARQTPIERTLSALARQEPQSRCASGFFVRGGGSPRPAADYLHEARRSVPRRCTAPRQLSYVW